MGLGENIQRLRKAKNLSREALCGDESQLSVRQLARIESDKSTPTLNKVIFLAKQLGISLNELIEIEDYELPSRYQELKYLIIRTATYGDPVRLKQGNTYFEEIFQHYYDRLPEDEKLAIKCLQSRWEVHTSDDVNFGTGILNDYLDQVQKRLTFAVNDLLLIDLYFLCSLTSLRQDEEIELSVYELLMGRLLDQENNLPNENLYVLNNVLLNSYYLATELGRQDTAKAILDKSQKLMVKIQDFQKRPILNFLQWKYALQYESDWSNAQAYYDDAVLFSKLIGDDHLTSKLEEEWAKEKLD